jgi:uncharacterized peroxidase-related enzyme
MIRLPSLKTGLGLKHKLLTLAAPIVKGMKVPDILYIIWHRPPFFSVPSGKLHQAVLRGPSDWSVAEREAFAGWVSIKNRCRYCADAHSATTNRAFGKKVLASLDEPMNVDELSTKARAMLPFLEKLTLDPERMSAADLTPLRKAGITDQAIADAVHIVMIFSFMNRIADATGCEPLSPKQADFTAKILLEKGYDH